LSTLLPSSLLDAPPLHLRSLTRSRPPSCTARSCSNPCLPARRVAVFAELIASSGLALRLHLQPDSSCRQISSIRWPYSTRRERVGLARSDVLGEHGLDRRIVSLEVVDGRLGRLHPLEDRPSPELDRV
jgi:hypothetical protein